MQQLGWQLLMAAKCRALQTFKGSDIYLCGQALLGQVDRGDPNILNYQRSH